MVHVTNLTPPGSDNPSRGLALAQRRGAGDVPGAGGEGVPGGRDPQSDSRRPGRVGLSLPGGRLVTFAPYCCRQLNVLTIRPTRVGTPGCQIGHMDHAGCRQLNRVLTAK
jgi:hypothetical protein